MTPIAKAFTILAGSFSSVITTLSFDPSCKTIAIKSTSQAGESPSWIVAHPTQKDVVFAVNEAPAGQLLAFKIEDNGSVTKLDQVTSGGSGPTHAEFVQGGKFLGAVNFEDGTATFAPTAPNGRFFTSRNPTLIKFPAPVSNPHQIIEHGNETLVPDLGANKIWRLQQENGTFAVKGSFDVGAGKGPRHGVVLDHTLYTLTEKTSELIQQNIPPLGQQAPTVATLSVVPTDVNKTTYFAGELITAGGLLYASNRNIGPADPRGDSIAIFQTKPQLQLARQVFTGLKNLRGMAFSPDKKFIIVGGNEVGGVAVFEVVGDDLKRVAKNDNVPPTTSYVWLS